MKRHPRILEAEGHPHEFKEAEGGDDGRLLDVGGVNRDLVVALLQIQLAEHRCPSQAARDVGHVGEGVAVRLCEKVEAAVVAARPP